MTDEELASAQALCNAATPGERWLNEYDGSICTGPDGEDAVEIGNVDFSSADISFTLLTSPDFVKQLIAALTEARATINRILPVYQAARGWRDTLDYKASRAAGDIFTVEQQMIDAVDDARRAGGP